MKEENEKHAKSVSSKNERNRVANDLQPFAFQ